MTNFEKVKEFMNAFGQDLPEQPTFPSVDTIMLRNKLINEEVDEFEASVLERDLVNTAKELADILYVTYGAAAAYGIDLDKVFEQVHNSNMSKLGPDGKPMYREDGKVLKGPNYFTPNLTWITK